MKAFFDSTWQAQVKPMKGYAFLDSTLVDNLQTQVKDELGPEYNRVEEKMVYQKYGLIPPQLTGSEKNLIICEEHHGTEFITKERRR